MRGYAAHQLSTSMVAEKYPELMALPDSQKLQCAAELWASVLGDSADCDPAMQELIEGRLADYHAHPEQVVPWSEVKAKVLASRK
jgi:putative addiction module component (TIGR02574 family)